MLRSKIKGNAMLAEIVAELAPTGVLRAGINLGNFLLVTGRSATGDPEGVSPSIAKAVGSISSGVPVRYVPFAKPGPLADAVDDNVWDIGSDRRGAAACPEDCFHGRVYRD